MSTHKIPFLNIKKETSLKLSQICNCGICSKGLKNEFETAVVNEPSVFEPLKFYCILYACESVIFTAGLEKRRQAFEIRCYQRLLNIPYKDHKIKKRLAERFKQQLKNKMTPEPDYNTDMKDILKCKNRN